MFFFEYATVTEVYKDDVYGAQLLNASGRLSNKNYTAIDIVSMGGITTLLKVGDVIVVLTLGNGHYVSLGTIQQFDLSMDQGEIVIQNGVKTELGQEEVYGIKSKFSINSDNEIEISVGEIENSSTYNKRIVIKLDKDFKLNLKTQNSNGEMQGQIEMNGQRIVMENAAEAKIELLDNGTVDVNGTIF